MSADTAREFLAHLAIAVSLHEKNARRSSLVVPSELLALRDIALSLATERQAAPPVEPVAVRADDEDMPRDTILLTKRDAAAHLRVSVRTVDRLVASGALPTVTVSSSTRIRRCDLEEYVDNLNPGPSRWREGITTKELA